MKEDDEDDAPTYVLEDTNQSLTKEEYDAMVSGKEPGETDGEAAAAKNADAKVSGENAKPKDKIAEVGGNAKKRKAAKIISEEQEESRAKDGVSVKNDAKVVRKSKKKAKVVKLTFGDEE